MPHSIGVRMTVLGWRSAKKRGRGRQSGNTADKKKFLRILLSLPFHLLFLSPLFPTANLWKNYGLGGQSEK